MMLCQTEQPKSTFLDETERAAQAEKSGFIGEELLRIGKPVAALIELNNAIAIMPNFWEARYNRAVAYLQLGESKNAANDLTKCLEIRPYEPNTLHLLSLIAWQDGKSSLAIILLEEAAARNPGKARVFRDLGQLYLLEQEWVKGRDALKHYLMLSPDAEDAQLALDLIQLSGNPEEQATLKEILTPPLPESIPPISTK